MGDYDEVILCCALHTVGWCFLCFLVLRSPRCPTDILAGSPRWVCLLGITAQLG
eukprot:gene11865-16229_t